MASLALDGPPSPMKAPTGRPAPWAPTERPTAAEAATAFGEQEDYEADDGFEAESIELLDEPAAEPLE